jgi:uncharacterized protein (TIGR03066 family)
MMAACGHFFATFDLGAHNMKTMLLMALALTVCCWAESAGRADDVKDAAKLLVGKWEATKVPEQGLPKGTIIEFSKDGKMTVRVKKDDKEVTMNGSYKLDNDKLAVALTDEQGEKKSQTVTIKKISADEFTVEGDDGHSATFTKKK